MCDKHNFFVHLATISEFILLQHAVDFFLEGSQEIEVTFRHNLKGIMLLSYICHFASVIYEISHDDAHIFFRFISSLPLPFCC